jgi:glycosyltransferase involved in cell wall biosynthesis
MKICMMTNTYLPHVGGVARSVSTFANEYRKRKHRVLVVAPTFEGKPLPHHLESFVERVPAIQKFNGSDFSVRMPLATALSDRIEDFSADIIHAHHPFLLGDSALRIAANKNVPVVFTHHTLYEDYTHYVPFDSPTLKEIAINLSTHFANLCDGVIAPSESLAKLITERGVTSPVQVVPTGIDVAAFARGQGARFRRKFDLPSNAFVVGHVGRLATEKNLNYLAEAVALFLKTAPEAYFLLVGTGPAEAELKKHFEEHGVSKQLILAGKQTGLGLHHAYAAMTVFAFSSKSETQGMVLAEAMAAGLPVVALDASGAREVVQNEQNGFLLPGDTTPAVFAEKLAQLHKEDALREAFIAKARATAELFSQGRCAELALTFYADIQRSTRRQRLLNEASPWGTLLHRMSVEWELLAGKAAVVAQAVTGDRESTAIESSE